jgi:hypothetical protein
MRAEAPIRVRRAGRIALNSIHYLAIVSASRASGVRRQICGAPRAPKPCCCATRSPRPPLSPPPSSHPPGAWPNGAGVLRSPLRVTPTDRAHLRAHKHTAPPPRAQLPRSKSEVRRGAGFLRAPHNSSIPVWDKTHFDTLSLSNSDNLKSLMLCSGDISTVTTGRPMQEVPFLHA